MIISHRNYHIKNWKLQTENWKVYRCARKRSNFWHSFGFDEAAVILWYNSLEFQSLRRVKMVIFLTKFCKTTNQPLLCWYKGKKYSIHLHCYCVKDSWSWLNRGEFGGMHSDLWVMGRLCRALENTAGMGLGSFMVWFFQTNFLWKATEEVSLMPPWFLQLHVEFATLSISLLHWLIQS